MRSLIIALWILVASSSSARVTAAPAPYSPMKRSLVPDIDRDVRIRSTLIFFSRYQQLMTLPLRSHAEADRLVAELNLESTEETGFFFSPFAWRAEGKSHLVPPPGIARGSYFKIVKAIDNYRVEVDEAHNPQDDLWFKKVPTSDFVFQTELRGSRGNEYGVFESKGDAKHPRQIIYFDPPDPTSHPEGVRLTYAEAFQIYSEADRKRDLWVRLLWTESGEELFQLFKRVDKNRYDVGFLPPGEYVPWWLPTFADSSERLSGPFSEEKLQDASVRENYARTLADYRKRFHGQGLQEEKLTKLNFLWTKTFGE
jgi:hypothetical protein